MIDQKLNFNQLAVFLIDMQDYFIDSKEKKDLIYNQIQVLKFSREKMIPVFVFEYRRWGKTNGLLLSELQNMPILYSFTKFYNDAFSAYKVEDTLKELGKKGLLLMGINAAFCVWETAISAIKKGYYIITSEDLIAGYFGVDGPNQDCLDHSWYRENGVVAPNYKILINNII